MSNSYLLLTGQTLDEKYKIERELGRGGMGSVYLATHVGTERAVAVKVIAPEFMRRGEFIERFRREARAAGRLRHPNVVDVTDFGIAETPVGEIAYLVMEYLDGCTLGEILEEEKNLPLSWTLDILEQTCAAVDEAHRQGIIHRDLKPDNIWLEPNARGGYTVKVLDFGIAKLEEPMGHDDDEETELVQSEQFKVNSLMFSNATQILSKNRTLAISSNSDSENNTLTTPLNSNFENAENGILNLENQNPTDFSHTLIQNPVANAETLIQYESSPSEENETAIFAAARATAAGGGQDGTGDDFKTKILTEPASNQTTSEKGFGTNTASLTRIGAVLGTPLYMSPEQCRGEKLDSRADVYSLGVIAYQMLSGAPPFTGKYTEVMEAHKEIAPPPLENKKVPRKVKKVIASALEKNADQRPATALAFASKLQANSEGVGALFRRALTIYNEHLPMFLKLTLLLFAPVILATFGQVAAQLLVVTETIPATLGTAISAVLSIIIPFINIFCVSILSGVTTWLVAQLMAVPLRPVRLRPAFQKARQHLRTFAGTVMLTSILSVVGLIAGLVPGAILIGFGAAYYSKSSQIAVIMIIMGIIVLLLGVSVGLILFVKYSLVTPVVMMENLRGRAALKRSGELVKRSRGTVIAVILINLFVPMMLSGVIALFLNLAINNAIIKTAPTETSRTEEKQPESEVENAEQEKPKTQINISVGSKVEIKEADDDPKSKSWKRVAREAGFQVIWLPFVMLIGSLASVVTGLLYLKTRQAGGESLKELLTQFEENDRTQKRWQLSLKEKLEQSGRHATNRNT
ncbi:MAG: serine/threonine-protein kinase [Pyrinomonadaceae bacterium]